MFDVSFERDYVKEVCEARDCFHLIVHLVNCFLFST